MIVAIDGPAGSGKSSVARRCSAETGLFYLNSGSFYRAVTWKVLKSGDEPTDRNAVIAAAQSLSFSVSKNELHIDGVIRESELRTDQIEAWVAEHSSIPEVRDAVNRNLRHLAHGLDALVEGRDMSTVVFPEADLKIYLDASLETRARRRFSQYRDAESVETVRQRIVERDEVDRSKEAAPLRVAPDALYLDTSDLTIEEVCAKVVDAILQKRTHQELQGSHG
jgi:cytidylate kinase